MCIQVIEHYALCMCPYYKHALDPCQQRGQRRHATQVKEVLVGYACALHQFNNSVRTCLNSIELQAPFSPSWGWSSRTTTSGNENSTFANYYEEHIASKKPYMKFKDSIVGPIDHESMHEKSMDLADPECIEQHQNKVHRHHMGLGAKISPTLESYQEYNESLTEENLIMDGSQFLSGKTITHVDSPRYAPVEQKTSPINIPLTSPRILRDVKTIACPNDSEVQPLSIDNNNLPSKSTCQPTDLSFDITDTYEEWRRTPPVEVKPCFSSIRNEGPDSQAASVAQSHKHQREYIPTNTALHGIQKRATNHMDDENQHCNRWIDKSERCVNGLLDTLGEGNGEKTEVDQDYDAVSGVQMIETRQDELIDMVPSVLSNPILESSAVLPMSVEDNIPTTITLPRNNNGVLPRPSLPLYQKSLLAMGLMEPPVERGKTRVRWTCRCGRRLYDDYEELRPGALEEIRQMLGVDQKNHRQRNGDKANEGGTGSIFRRSFKEFIGFTAQRFSRKDGSSLPVTELTTQSRCPPSSGSQQQPGEILFLLMCINHSRWIPKLWQENACSITSDQQLFRIFRAAHRSGHSSSRQQRLVSLFNLKSLSSIRFVQFEAFKNYLVTITKVPDLPPPKYSAEYRPCYAATNPPVGENLLMHYYHHPHDADDALVWFDRIPKKLNRRVQIDGNTRTELGWGVHFVEGLDWMKLWTLGLVGLLLSMLLGVLWSIFNQSIQSGFAISACLMILITFTTGVVQAAFVRAES